jgi:hypothetical protein
MSSTSTLGKSLLYFWYSELILNYIGSGGLTPPKTKLCQQVMDYVKDSNGIEIQDSSGDSIPILCGAEFPDSEDGPWCIWLDLCADCYRKYRTDDMESVSQMSQTSYLSVPSKTLRVTMDGKIGTYEQFGNCGMNRIALDDGSFSVTVNSEDYLENWFPKLSFVDCNHPQCRARATTSCSNPTCVISTCSQHTQETCICAVLHDLSAAGDGRLPPATGDGRLPPPAAAAAGDGRLPPPAAAGDGRLPPPPPADGDGRLPPPPAAAAAAAGDGRLPPPPPAAAADGDGRLPPPAAAAAGDGRLPPPPPPAAAGDGRLPPPPPAAADGDGRLPPAADGDGRLPPATGDGRLPPAADGDGRLPPAGSDGRLPPPADIPFLVPALSIDSVADFFQGFEAGEQKGIHLLGKDCVFEMAALSCDLEKAAIKTKYFVNVKGHGPVDIYKYNKWIFVDAYHSRSNKSIMLLSNS